MKTMMTMMVWHDDHHHDGMAEQKRSRASMVFVVVRWETKSPVDSHYYQIASALSSSHTTAVCLVSWPLYIFRGEYKFSPCKKNSKELNNIPRQKKQLQSCHQLVFFLEELNESYIHAYVTSLLAILASYEKKLPCFFWMTLYT